MKSFLLSLLLLCTQFGFSQKRVLRKNKLFTHSFALATMFSSDSELSFQYEKKVKVEATIFASIGFKKHQLSNYFQEEAYYNTYTIAERKITFGALGLTYSEGSSTYLFNTTPMERIGVFIPKTTVPIQFGYRKYIQYGKNKLVPFIGMGVHAFLHSGFAIDDTKTILARERESSGGSSILLSIETSKVTTKYGESRIIGRSTTVTPGIDLSLGLRWSFHKHWNLLFTGNWGKNMKNTNPYQSYYGISSFYLNGFLSLAYSI